MIVKADQVQAEPAQGDSGGVPRFHCPGCRHPFTRESGMQISYGYRGERKTYLACPTCILVQILLQS